MLARADGTKKRFYSMSSAIEVARKASCDQLEHTHRGDLDITERLLWFLGCLERAIDQADDTSPSVTFRTRLWERLIHDPRYEPQE